MLNFNFLQFGEILGILPNTVARSFNWEKDKCYFLRLPGIEIPKRFKFNHHQSVGNSISFLVDPKFSNLVVCFVFPSKDVNTGITFLWKINIYINDELNPDMSGMYVIKDNYDHVWLVYGEVNTSNPSEENRIKVEVIHPGIDIPLNGMRIYVECICCPQKGEEDSGCVGIRPRLQRRNHQPIHARHPHKHYLSRFGMLSIRFQLWKRSSKPWRWWFTNGFHNQGSSSIPNTFFNYDSNANLYRPS